MDDLTDRQSEVLLMCVERFVVDHRIPTIEQIAGWFNFRTNAAWSHLAGLRRKGYLELNAGGKLKFTDKAIEICGITIEAKILEDQAPAKKVQGAGVREDLQT